MLSWHSGRLLPGLLGTAFGWRTGRCGWPSQLNLERTAQFAFSRSGFLHHRPFADARDEATRPAWLSANNGACCGLVQSPLPRIPPRLITACRCAPGGGGHKTRPGWRCCIPGGRSLTPPPRRPGPCVIPRRPGASPPAGTAGPRHGSGLAERQALERRRPRTVRHGQPSDRVARSTSASGRDTNLRKALPCLPLYARVTAVRFMVSSTPGFGSSLTATTVRAGRCAPMTSA
jgi:hypothetical protein